jgi:two-component system cell cycle sensor histidine kinase/response regulator CckA
MADELPLPAPPPPTILVVEDEVTVRLAACRMIRGLGFEVAEAGDGREALRLIRQREAPFALVLTDVVMPVMDGLELSRVLSEERPGQPVLCMSAYPTTTLAGHNLLPERPFIRKPFLPTALSSAIREAIQAPIS